MVGNKYNDMARQIMEEQMMEDKGRMPPKRSTGPSADPGNQGYSGASPETQNFQQEHVTDTAGNSLANEPSGGYPTDYEPETARAKANAEYEQNGSETAHAQRMMEIGIEEAGGPEGFINATGSQVGQLMGFQQPFTPEEAAKYDQVPPERRMELWEAFINSDGLSDPITLIDELGLIGAPDPRQGIKPTQENPG